MKKDTNDLCAEWVECWQRLGALAKGTSSPKPLEPSSEALAIAAGLIVSTTALMEIIAKAAVLSRP